MPLTVLGERHDDVQHAQAAFASQLLQRLAQLLARSALFRIEMLRVRQQNPQRIGVAQARQHAN